MGKTDEGFAADYEGVYSVTKIKKSPIINWINTDITNTERKKTISFFINFTKNNNNK